MKRFSLFLVLIFFCAAAVEAQQSSSRRRNPRRTRPAATARTTQPPVTAPQRVLTLEPEIISTAAEDELNEQNSTNADGQQIVLDPRGANSSSQPATNTRSSSSSSSGNRSRNRQDELTNQVKALTDKINSLEKQQRNLLNLERLNRAEERAETLRRQLSDAIEKESNLNSKIEQLTYELRPEMIERSSAVIGSTRPEEVRDARRKMLENEMKGARTQLTQIQTNKTRLETAIANADLLVEKLRARVEEELDPADRLEEPKKAKDAETQSDEVEAVETTEPPIDN